MNSKIKSKIKHLTIITLNLIITSILLKLDVFLAFAFLLGELLAIITELTELFKRLGDDDYSSDEHDYSSS
ncbi:MAG: hypothetical protein ACP5IZ_10825 [Thermoprotei archaeon]